MIVVLYGPPGSGKGSVSSLLRELGFSVFTPGNAIRNEIKNNGEFAGALMITQTGGFAPDQFIIDLTRREINNNANIVLDGVPRSIGQASGLAEDLVGALNIYMSIEKEECLDRISRRLVCASCQESIHPGESRCSVHPDIDPIVRADDNKDVFENRWHIFQTVTAPVIPSDARIVDATMDLDDVFKEIKDLITQSIANRAVDTTRDSGKASDEIDGLNA